MSNQNLLNKKDLLAYFLVAGTGAIVQLLCQSLLEDWFNVSFTWSIPIAYTISLSVGFVLTKLFAFDARNNKKSKREMVKFMMVSFFSFFVMWFATLLAKYLMDKIWLIPNYTIPNSSKTVNINQLVSAVIGMCFSFASNYYFHKTFTFKSTGFYDRLKNNIK